MFAEPPVKISPKLTGKCPACQLAVDLRQPFPPFCKAKMLIVLFYHTADSEARAEVGGWEPTYLLNYQRVGERKGKERGRKAEMKIGSM